MDRTESGRTLDLPGGAAGKLERLSFASSFLIFTSWEAVKAVPPLTPGSILIALLGLLSEVMVVTRDNLARCRSKAETTQVSFRRRCIQR